MKMYALLSNQTGVSIRLTNSAIADTITSN